ncbi:protein adenylyltransferase SelO, mitochondrial, partial [Trichonephila clavata]
IFNAIPNQESHVEVEAFAAVWSCNGIVSIQRVNLSITVRRYLYPGHIDDGGRYTYIKQPEICLWNLKKFAEAIQHALPLDVSAPLLELYEEEFKKTYMNKMRSKIGLIATECPEDENLVQELFDTMEKSGADFTNTFLCFLIVDASDADKLQSSLNMAKEKIIENCYPVEDLLNTCRPNLNSAQLQTFIAIANSNPEIIEQLGRAGLTIKRVLSQLEKTKNLEDMTEESKFENDRHIWTEWLNKYRQRLGKDLKAYNGDATSYNWERLNIMKTNNPRFILRNYIAQEAIEKAENGDFFAVRKLVEILENPYDQCYTKAINEEAANVQSEEDFCPTAKICTVASRLTYFYRYIFRQEMMSSRRYFLYDRNICKSRYGRMFT